MGSAFGQWGFSATQSLSMGYTCGTPAVHSFMRVGQRMLASCLGNLSRDALEQSRACPQPSSTAADAAAWTAACTAQECQQALGLTAAALKGNSSERPSHGVFLSVCVFGGVC